MSVIAKILMKVLTLLIGIPVGIAVRKAVERAWGAARPADPPRKVDDSGVRWADALSWAALSAAGVVLAKLLTRRGAEAAYRGIIGEPPQPAKQPDAEKLEKRAKKVAKTATKDG